MFRRLGTKIDNLIVDIKEFIRVKHLCSFYYKFYLYIRIPEMTNHPEYDVRLKQVYERGQIYKWQYDRLNKLEK